MHQGNAGSHYISVVVWFRGGSPLRQLEFAKTLYAQTPVDLVPRHLAWLVSLPLTRNALDFLTVYAFKSPRP